MFVFGAGSEDVRLTACLETHECVTLDNAISMVFAQSVMVGVSEILDSSATVGDPGVIV